MSTALERYEAVIGVEVHCQLRTASKMFCSCSTAYDGARPNSHVCPVCLGLPGALPVINRRAVELVLSTGAAIGASTPDATRWDRKNYFYPDLPKGYQISQYDLPLAAAGALTFDTSAGPFAWMSFAVSSSRWARVIPIVTGPSDVSNASVPADASGRSYWLIW